MQRIVLAAALTLALPIPPPSHAASYHGAARMLRLSPPRVARGPVIDGALDDPVWGEAAVLDSFTQLDPVVGPRDTTGTRCLLLYDDRRLYVGFECPGSGVRAPWLPREGVDPGDYVAVGIDGYHDRRRMAYFYVTPRGVQADGMIVEGQDDDPAVDFQFDSRGRVTAGGYQVEIAIPFRSLRFPRRDPLVFGFNAARSVPGRGLFVSWAPVSPDSGPAVAQIGVLEEIRGVHPGNDLQLIPTLTGTRREVPGLHGLEAQPVDTRAGVSAKLGLSSSMTADLAVTPDFSQVEADASVVDVNERFAIFYPERRPFFLEGAEIFRTPIQAVYTRRIDDPLYGVRLTGKQGGTSIGVLHAHDRLGGGSGPYVQIARIRQDVFTNGTIGVLAASREHGASHNRLGGLDGRFVIHDKWTLQGQGLFDRAPGADTLPAGPVSGSAWTASLDRTSRRLGVGLSLLDISPHFTADMGFIPRTDEIQVSGYLSPTFFPTPGARVQSVTPEITYTRIHRHGATRHVGARTDDELGFQTTLLLASTTTLGAGYTRAYTLVQERAFPGQDRVAVWGESHRFAAVQGGFNVSYGDDVVFAEAVPGRSWRWSGWTDLRFTPQLDAQLNLAGLTLERRETRVRFADALIPRLRVTYQHNRELSFRWITEIDSERQYDPAWGRVPARSAVTVDLLATYLLHPGTVAYLGYGRLDSGDALDGARPERSSTFFKVSYLFQR